MTDDWQMKLEYTGSFFRIVLEVFHREPAIFRRHVAAQRNGEEFRRKLLRKVIHKIGKTKV
jgi:hypothetical protein